MSQAMTLSDKGVGLLRHFEQGPKGGFASTVYIDSTGHPTIGWGHMLVSGEKFDTPITREQADAIFLKDAARFVKSAHFILGSWGIKSYTQDQFDALVCLIYNVGPGRRDNIKGDVADSTLMERWAKGNIQGAADQFLVWNKGRVNGKLTALRGLTRRRNAERHLFLTGELKFYF